jgi:hypothetical protein
LQQENFMRLISRCSAVLIGAVLVSGGCATAERGGLSATGITSARDFSSRRFNAGMEEVGPVAERVFRSHFRVDQEASTATHLVSRPTEVEGRGEPHNVRDRIRLAPGRQRQMAEMNLDPQGGATMVQVSVRSQRLETSERATFARMRGDDRPAAQTPIDRPGPTGVDTREQWVNAGRDTQTERDVLDEIQASLEGEQSTTAPAAP